MQDLKQDQAQSPNPPQKTTGEKYFERLRFGVAEVFILAATAAIAYVARYGSDSKLNVFKQIQKGFEKVLSPVSKIGKEGTKLNDIAKTIAGAGASSMVTFHGGNAFAPVMKWFNNSKARMVHNLNEKYGAPGETEIGDEHTKNEPKQTWGDVLKGRLVAWATVFTSFVSAGILAGKKDGIDRFDRFEDWFGKKMANFTKDGEKIAKLSVHERMTNPTATNRTYKFGRILALDIYATTMAIMIWNAISKTTAAKRIKSNDIPDELEYQSIPDHPKNAKNFTDTIKPNARVSQDTPEATMFTQRVEERTPAELSLG